MQLDSQSSPDGHSGLPAIPRAVPECLIDPANLSSRERAQMARWNALSSTQAQRINPSRQKNVEMRQRKLLQEYPALAKKSALILDIGSGAGCATNIIRQYSDRVIAIDLAPRMAEQSVTLQALPYHRVIQYSVTSNLELSSLNQPINNNTVDGVICFGAFQNFVEAGSRQGEFDQETAQKVLKRIFDLLKPGSVAAIQYLIPQEGQFDVQTTLIDPVVFRRLCEQAGFVIKQDSRVSGYYNRDSGREIFYQHTELIKPVASLEYLLPAELTEFERRQTERRDGLAPTQTERSADSGCSDFSVIRQSIFIAEHPDVIRPDKLILAFGLSAGAGTAKFRESGANVIGLEISPKMAAVAACQQQHPFKKVVVYSPSGNRELSELKEPIKDGTVDYIVSYGSFPSFIPKGCGNGEFDQDILRRTLSRMFRLLKPGGLISVNFLPPHSEISFHELSTTMDPQIFSKIMEETGFRINSDRRDIAYRNEAKNSDVYYQFIEARKP